MLLIVLAVFAEQAPLPTQWAQFKREGALSRVVETVDIAYGIRKRADQFSYTLRFTQTAPGKELEIKWTDSTTCPTVRSVVLSMHDIVMPSPAPYGTPGELITIVADGVGYSLSAPSTYLAGRMTITSNWGSPLAHWIDGSLTQLARCWRQTKP